MRSNNPRVSIFIPVKNGIDTLPELYKSIKVQNFAGNEIEICIVDSGSTDGTVDWIKEKTDIKLFEIPPEEFNHGSTRNMALEHCWGEIIFFTVQDAKLHNNEVIKSAIKHFDNSCVAGVCGKQMVPHHKSKNPHEWYRPQGMPEVRSISITPEQFDKLKPADRRNLCGWDNVVALYRKEALRKVPFQKIDFGEDMLWAKNAIEAGFHLIYDDNLLVEHYHHVNFDFHYKRTLILLYHQLKIFNFIPDWSFHVLPYLRILKNQLRHNINFKWLFYQCTKVFAAQKAYTDIVKSFPDSVDHFYNLKIKKIPIGRQ